MNDLLRRWLNLPPQASTFAFGVDVLHYFVIGVTTFGAVSVFLLAVVLLVRYRRRAPGELSVRSETPLALEASVSGGILILFLAFWVVGATQYNRMMSPPDGAMTIYVTAKQWMWTFSYPDGRASMDMLTVPAHRPVKLVMTSRDVIHSFYVPAFRLKHDVVPGRYYTAWFEATAEGAYAIECAEYCGVNHSRMLGTVQVLSESDYGRWLDGQRTGFALGQGASGDGPAGDLALAGREVAARKGCLSCHSLDGQPHIGPSWAGLYDSDVELSDGGHVLADEAYLTRSMMDPEAQVVFGYKNVMPTYAGLLEEPEVAALVEFIKGLQYPPFPSSGIALPHVVVEAPGAPAPGEPEKRTP